MRHGGGRREAGGCGDAEGAGQGDGGGGQERCGACRTRVCARSLRVGTHALGHDNTSHTRADVRVRDISAFRAGPRQERDESGEQRVRAIIGPGLSLVCECAVIWSAASRIARAVV
jgi:hypothetical protein